MKKRGISHIEMIMAFILFISAVAFVFIFLNPFTTNNPTLAVEKYSLNKLTDLIKTNATTYFLIITKDLDVQNIINSKIITVSLGFRLSPLMRVRIENYSGSILPSGISTDGNYIYLNWSRENGRIILLSLSEDFTTFDPALSNPLALNEEYYQISSSVFSESISERKAASIIEEYTISYSALKESLTIPSQADFGFKLSLPYKVYVANKTIPENIEVKSRNRIASVVGLDGNKTIGSLEISIW
jgi:hypothetical protein